jgi:hypothetical protein
MHRHCIETMPMQIPFSKAVFPSQFIHTR